MLRYFVSFSVLAHKYKVDKHRERLSPFRKHCTEIIEGDMPFPEKIKNITTIENNWKIDI